MKIVFDMDNTLADEFGRDARPGMAELLERLLADVGRAEVDALREKIDELNAQLSAAKKSRRRKPAKKAAKKTTAKKTARKPAKKAAKRSTSSRKTDGK